MAKEKNIFKTFKSYLLTEDLKKLWHKREMDKRDNLKK